jgi:glycosyltransferase involved in cell wall biosynthesis
MLGSVIAVAKELVDKVYVLSGGYDRRVYSIAASLDAEPVDLSPIDGLESAFSMIPDSSEVRIVLLNGDGSHDPYQIQRLFEQLDNGYDIAVSSNPIDYGPMNENVLFLNNKTARGRFTGFIACTGEYLKRSLGDIKANEKLDIPMQVYFYARSNDLKIKALDNEGFELFSLFRIGVVVPAFNEELLLADTIKGIPGYVTRIYIIDDGSTDHTPEVIKSIVDPRVRSVRHEPNKGVGAAIITGYKMALEDDMDIVAVMAGDNQMDPDQLPRLLLPIIEDKADYTKGNRLISREFRKGMSSWRSFGNSILTLITKIGSGYWDIMDPQNGYTAISRHALEAINFDSIYTYYGYCNDLLIKLNAFSMRTMDIAMPARYGTERSSIKYSKYIMKVAPMIFRGFLWRLKTKYVVLSFHPLVFFYAAGIVMVPFGVLFSLWILVEKILRQPVSSNYPLLAAFITLMGVQLLLFAMLFDMQNNKNKTSSI